MLKIAVALVFVGAVTAQVDVSSNNNDLTISRRQEVDVFDMSTSVASTLAELQGQVNVLSGGNSPVTVGLQAISSDMIARSNDILSTQTDTTAQLSTLEAAMARMDSVMNNVQSAVSQQIAAAENAALSRAAVAADRLSAATEAIEDQVNEGMVNITRSVGQTVTNLTADVAAVQQALSAKADTKTIVWSGGCSEYPGGGWRWYCLNRQLYNTAAGYFVKHDHTYFRAVRSNIYIRLVMFTITHGSGWNRMLYYLNDRTFYYTYSHTAGCWWKDMHGDMLFAVSNGNRWRVRMYGACSHAFHPGGNMWDTHSRVTVYVAGTTQ